MSVLGHRGLAAALLAAALGAAGCAAGGATVRDGEPAPRATLAMLPLENLSGRAEYADRFSRVIWSALGRSGRWNIIDPGQVDALLVELRIRSAGSLTTEQVLEVAGRLRARWIVAGTLLECGTVRTPDGDIPTFSLALRLLDGRDGRVVWTDLLSRTGQDRETIFGWGREESLDRLAETTARELIERMKTPDPTDSTSSSSEGKS